MSFQRIIDNAPYDIDRARAIYIPVRRLAISKFPLMSFASVHSRLTRLPRLNRGRCFIAHSILLTGSRRQSLTAANFELYLDVLRPPPPPPLAGTRVTNFFPMTL